MQFRLAHSLHSLGNLADAIETGGPALQGAAIHRAAAMAAQVDIMAGRLDTAEAGALTSRLAREAFQNAAHHFHGGSSRSQFYPGADSSSVGVTSKRHSLFLNPSDPTSVFTRLTDAAIDKALTVVADSLLEKGRSTWMIERGIQRKFIHTPTAESPYADSNWQSVDSSIKGPYLFVESIPKPLYRYFTDRSEWQIDEANVDSKSLIADWKNEKAASAQSLRELLELAMIQASNEALVIEISTNDFAGPFLHNQWLKRNSWAAKGPLDVPYSQLSKSVQERNILAPLRKAVFMGNKALTDHGADIRFILK